MLADKTVVLATNQLQFVSMADVVVVMRAGAAVEVGSYAELLNAGGLFTALMKEAQVSQGSGCGVQGLGFTALMREAQVSQGSEAGVRRSEGSRRVVCL